MLMQQWGSEQSVDNSGASSHLYQPADTADSVWRVVVLETKVYPKVRDHGEGPY